MADVGKLVAKIIADPSGVVQGSATATKAFKDAAKQIESTKVTANADFGKITQGAQQAAASASKALADIKAPTVSVTPGAVPRPTGIVGQMAFPAISEAQGQLRTLAQQAQQLAKSSADPALFLQLSQASRSATAAMKATQQQAKALRGEMGREAQLRILANPTHFLRGVEQAKKAVANLRKEVEGARPMNLRGMFSGLGKGLMDTLKNLPKTLMGGMGGGGIGSLVGAVAGGNIMGGLGSMLGAAGPYGAIAAAALQAASAIGQMVMQTAALVDETAKVSDRLGFVYERFQAVSHAANLAGVGQEELTQSMTIFTRTLGHAARGDQGAIDSFRRLGLSARQLADMAPDEALIRVSEALNRLGSSSDRTAAAQDLFGRAGARMLNFLERAKDNIDTANAELERMGFLLTRADAAKIETMNDAFTSLAAQGQAFLRVLAANIAGPVTDVVKHFMVVGRIAMMIFKPIVAVVMAVLGPVRFLLTLFDKLVQIIFLPFSMLGRVFTALFNNGASFWEQLSTVYDAVQPIIDAMYDVAAAIGDIWAEAFGGGFDMKGIADFVRFVAEGIGGAIRSIIPFFRTIGEIIGGWTGMIRQFVNSLGRPLLGAIVNVLGVLQRAASALAGATGGGGPTNAQPGFWGQVGQFLQGAGAAVGVSPGGLPGLAAAQGQAATGGGNQFSQLSQQIQQAQQALQGYINNLDAVPQATKNAMMIDEATVKQNQKIFDDIGRALKDRFKSPMADIRKQMAELQKAFAAGLIDPATFNRGMADALRQMRQQVGEVQLPVALEAGSSGAISAINQFRTQQDGSRDVASLLQAMQRIEEAQLAADQRAANALESNNALLQQFLNSGGTVSPLVI